MIQAADPITLSLPRSVLADIITLSTQFTDRMHQLLERNTNGDLTPPEKAELEALVRVAQFGQIASMALQSPSKP